MTESQKVTKVAEILKKRFPKLLPLDTVDLAIEIVNALKDE